MIFAQPKPKAEPQSLAVLFLYPEEKKRSDLLMKHDLDMLLFPLVGYLSGSVLYAQLFVRLFTGQSLTQISDDHNPGTANAFQYGGFLCGGLTLVCELLKGFVPVHLFMEGPPRDPYICALVLAAPVIGHTFSVFSHFHGGKGIAVTFGCLLGLLPLWQPFAVLAAFFLLFSVVLRISPHYYRTLAAYIASLVGMIFVVDRPEIRSGFCFMSIAVLWRMLTSKEKKEQMEVKPLWKH